MCYYIPTNQSFNWFEKLIAKINCITLLKRVKKKRKIKTLELDFISL